MTEQIKWAIERLTKHARAFADAQDFHAAPLTQVDRENHIKHVRKVSDQMEALADRPTATFLDFEALLKSDEVPAAPLDFTDAIADAFLAAGRLS